jgi:hypothetical protein
MAQLLGVSLKAIQSFEQGWRNIPVHTERQSLLLLALKRSNVHKNRPCWLVLGCAAEVQKKCPAREFNAGYMCWLINGTICHGKEQVSWQQKMELCRKCNVFQNVFSGDAK